MRIQHIPTSCLTFAELLRIIPQKQGEMRTLMNRGYFPVLLNHFIAGKTQDVYDYDFAEL